jgi:hypothetical protein
VRVIWDWLNPLLETGRNIDLAFFSWLEGLATSPDQEARNFLSAGLGDRSFPVSRVWPVPHRR